MAWLGDTLGVILAIRRQPGTNTVQVVDNIKALLPVFREEIPPALNLQVIYDASEPIRNSLNDVKFTLVLTICLVVMVIFSILAKPVGHVDSRSRGAPVHRGNIRRHVSAGI